MRRARVRLGIAFALAAIACQSGSSPGSVATDRRGPPQAQSARPVLIRGPSHGTPVAEFIAAEVRKGKAEHFGVLVYVGAKWCEPCQRFHHAVTAGELDTLLSGMHVVEFDLDEDRSMLERAGYSSALIPLFAVPRPDGTASDLRMEGSIKGESSVTQNLSPRLRALLDRARHIG